MACKLGAHAPLDWSAGASSAWVEVCMSDAALLCPVLVDTLPDPRPTACQLFDGYPTMPRPPRQIFLQQGW